MADQLTNTQTKILEAASRVFQRKGMEGARMQEIADEAGINKALLHYYYRSKDKLFLEVFRLAIHDFIPGIKDILFTDAPLAQKLDRFISEYMRVLLENPFVPMFIIHELQRDPDRLSQVFVEAGIDPSEILQQVKRSLQDNDHPTIDPKHLMINVLSLCIFPVAARPLLQRIMFDNDGRAYEAFLQERYQVISNFVINALQS